MTPNEVAKKLVTYTTYRTSGNARLVTVRVAGVRVEEEWVKTPRQAWNLKRKWMRYVSRFLKESKSKP